MNLKEIRLSLGMTQGALGKALGVSRNYITLIETGQRTPSEALMKAASELAESGKNVSNNANSAALATLLDKLDSLETRLETIEQILLKLLAKPQRK